MNLIPRRALSAVLAMTLACTWVWYFTRELAASETSPTEGVANPPPRPPGTSGETANPANSFPSSYIGKVHEFAAYAGTVASLDAADFPAAFDKLKTQWTQIAPGDEQADINTGATFSRRPRGNPQFELLLGRWGEVDPQGAMKTLAGETDPLNRATWENHVLHGWTARDPQTAWDWIIGSLKSAEGAENGVPPFQSVRLLVFFTSLIEFGHPELATSFMSRAELPEVSLFAPGIAEVFAESNEAAAREWAGTLTGLARSNAQSDIIRTIARKDPARAWTLIQQLPEEQMSLSAAHVMTTFAERQDADGAYNWLQSINADNNANGRLDNAIRSLMGLSPFASTPLPMERALPLIESIKNPSTRNLAAGSYAQKIAGQSPEEAVGIVLKVYEPSRVNSGLSSIVLRLAGQNVDRTIEFIKTSPSIPDQNRAGLLNLAEQQRFR